jgi:hypothetical protein
MTTESPARTSRPRSWLLIALAVVVVALIFSKMWSNGAAVSPPPSSPARAANGKPSQPFDPKELKVRLEALEAPKPEEGSTERNPFRFQPKAPPAPTGPAPKPEYIPPTQPTQPIQPQVAPIPLKLTGFIELPGGTKLAQLSDCKSGTFSAAEGKTVDGQYRVVKIGIESVTIEYINGKGQTTLRVEGCPPRDR